MPPLCASFTKCLHALDIAELFGTWANVLTDVKEAAQKANKQVNVIPNIIRSFLKQFLFHDLNFSSFSI